MPVRCIHYRGGYTYQLRRAHSDRVAIMPEEPITTASGCSASPSRRPTRRSRWRRRREGARRCEAVGLSAVREAMMNEWSFTFVRHRRTRSSVR